MLAPIAVTASALRSVCERRLNGTRYDVSGAVLEETLRLTGAFPAEVVGLAYGRKLTCRLPRARSVLVALGEEACFAACGGAGEEDLRCVDVAFGAFPARRCRGSRAAGRSG